VEGAGGFDRDLQVPQIGDTQDEAPEKERARKKTLQERVDRTDMQRRRVKLYCDGGCRDNQRRGNVGGWGVRLEWGPHVKELSGSAKDTTNNKMELTAAIEGLRAVRDKSVGVDVYADSAYVIGGLTSWVGKWKKNGWVTSTEKPVANRELWEALDEERDKFSDIAFHKVKGHADNAGNNRADELANIAMDKASSNPQDA
jgi:ribonuclease HI